MAINTPNNSVYVVLKHKINESFFVDMLVGQWWQGLQRFINN